MPRRYFVSEIKGDICSVTGDELHHIERVMRLSVGDKLLLSCNDGFDYYGTIQSIDRKEARVRIDNKEPNISEPTIDLTVFQALLKGEKMEIVCQKLNELGARTLFPMTTQFTTAQNVRADRLEKIVLESSKQCGRANFIKIEETIDFETALTLFQDFDVVIFAYENEKDLLLSDVLTETSTRESRKIALVVGSEGGFSTEEIDEARQENARIVTLGKRIMRAETAAVALTAVTMYEVGEWKP